MLLFILAFALVEADHQQYGVDAGHQVWDVIAEDVDQDGHGDILALCGETEAGKSRYLVGFMGGAGYAARPAWQLEIPLACGAVFLAETDGQAPRELVLANADGATIYVFGAKGFQETRHIAISSMLPSASPKLVFTGNLAIDLDGDGRDEWILPMASGYEVRKPDQTIAQVACNVNSEIREGEELRIIHSYPRTVVFDFGDDGRKALAFVNDENIDFAYGDSWSTRKRVRLPANPGEQWRTVVQLIDLTSDSFPDLAITHMRGSPDAEVRTQLYTAVEPFQYSESPVTTFEEKRVLASPYFRDFDNDGDADILFIKIPIGIRALINYFLTRRVQVNAELYLNDGRFDPEPVFSESLGLQAPDGDEQVAYAFGDFNGDGLVDVTFGTDTETMAVHVSGKDRFLSRHPWATVSVRPSGIARPYTLDPGRGQDLVVFHPNGPNASRIDIVIF